MVLSLYFIVCEKPQQSSLSTLFFLLNPIPNNTAGLDTSTTSILIFLQFLFANLPSGGVFSDAMRLCVERSKYTRESFFARLTALVITRPLFVSDIYPGRSLCGKYSMAGFLLCFGPLHTLGEINGHPAAGAARVGHS